MVSSKNFKYKGQASEVLDPIIFSDYEIKSLKHGNTGHILFRYPSKNHNWEKFEYLVNTQIRKWMTDKWEKSE